MVTRSQSMAFLCRGQGVGWVLSLEAVRRPPRGKGRDHRGLWAWEQYILGTLKAEHTDASSGELVWSLFVSLES